MALAGLGSMLDAVGEFPGELSQAAASAVLGRSPAFSSRAALVSTADIRPSGT